MPAPQIRGSLLCAGGRCGGGGNGYVTPTGTHAVVTDHEVGQTLQSSDLRLETRDGGGVGAVIYSLLHIDTVLLVSVVVHGVAEIVDTTVEIGVHFGELTVGFILTIEIGDFGFLLRELALHIQLVTINHSVFATAAVHAAVQQTQTTAVTGYAETAEDSADDRCYSTVSSSTDYFLPSYLGTPVSSR